MTLGAKTLPYQITPVDGIRQFFRSQAKHVISFAGFGELGYEEEDVVECIVRDVLRHWKTGELIVNSGTLLRVDGLDGIARVHAVANAAGFMTSGIHPSVALDFAATHRVSPYEQHVFFVDDSSWGGFIGPAGELSPTLEIILEVSDELVVVGGGKHAADELAAFIRSGKKTRYFPAEMNHRTTEDWCMRSGASITDFRGAAREVWSAMGPGQTD